MVRARVRSVNTARGAVFARQSQVARRPSRGTPAKAAIDVDLTTGPGANAREPEHRPHKRRRPGWNSATRVARPRNRGWPQTSAARWSRLQVAWRRRRLGTSAIDSTTAQKPPVSSQLGFASRDYLLRAVPALDAPSAKPLLRARRVFPFGLGSRVLLRMAECSPTGPSGAFRPMRGDLWKIARAPAVAKCEDRLVLRSPTRVRPQGPKRRAFAAYFAFGVPRSSRATSHGSSA